jgi:hypothetical protein
MVEVLPRGSSTVRVSDLRVGNAILSTAAISQRVEEAVERVPHISDARAVVKSGRKGVKVALDLHVDPEANLATVTDEACEAATDLLTNRIHVALAEPPRARLHYRELRLQRASQGRAATPVAPPPPPAGPPADSPRSFDADERVMPADIDAADEDRMDRDKSTAPHANGSEETERTASRRENE